MGFRRPCAAVLIATLVALPSCGGGGPSAGYTLAAGDGTGTGTVPSAAGCPSTGSSPSSAASTGEAQVRRLAPRSATAAVPGLLAVTYARSRQDLAAVVPSTVRSVRVGDLDFDKLQERATIVAVQGDESAAESALRALSGVRVVAHVKYSARMTVSANDPYYTGFAGTAAPYYETATVPGQWDMHAIDAAGGWNAAASAPPVAGSKAPIAIVDTGVDVTHPELAGAVVRTACFVTYPAGSTQTTGSYVTDLDGHGTDVAGIAGGVSNNAFGFASASYDAQLLAYRVFPSPPSSGCDSSSTSAQCETNSVDEASAINDAVAHGARVINLSLGSEPPCDTHDVEYLAVENALAHNVVVVASAGNGDPKTGIGEPHLDCPAADPGVIAAGATGLNDSNPAAVSEVMAPYSNYLTSSSGLYVVAPGGNASSSSDTDDLHWIENLYSSAASDGATAQYCKPDYLSTTNAADCRALFEGTSQAAPHVAGVAALVIAVRPGYTPAQVAAALCNSADSIGDPHQGCGRVDAAAAVRYALAH